MYVNVAMTRATGRGRCERDRIVHGRVGLQRGGTVAAASQLSRASAALDRAADETARPR
jgi:hypothetical protein